MHNELHNVTLHLREYHSIMSYCASHVTKNMTIGRHIIMSSPQKIWLTPQKTWLQAVKKLAVTFHVACHVGKKYDTYKSYYTSAENMTTWSHMPRRIGIFSVRAGQKWAQTPRLVKVCPMCSGNHRIYHFIRPHNRIYSYDSCPKRLVGND